LGLGENRGGRSGGSGRWRGGGRGGGRLAGDVEFDLLGLDRGGGAEREQGEREGGLEFHLWVIGVRGMETAEVVLCRKTFGCACPPPRMQPITPRLCLPLATPKFSLPTMTLDQFWTSQDGQILTVKNKDERSTTLTLAFWPRNPAEFESIKLHLADLKFTERSSLARIGIEMLLQGPPVIDGNRLILTADAFIYDQSFPNAPYWKKLLRPGMPVGRLFYAPISAKLSSSEIWAAIKANDLELPNTISIDSRGRVFLTPHQVSYTLSTKLSRLNFENIVSGNAGRGFLDKVQVRHDASPLTIAPHSGILTSCSMYLKEHYVVLNQGEGNFGLHTSAILLDPIKTFGTNVMLEIYQHRRPSGGESDGVGRHLPRPAVHAIRNSRRSSKKRQRLLGTATELFKCLDANPPADTARGPPAHQDHRPRSEWHHREPQPPRPRQRRPPQIPRRRRLPASAAAP